MPPAITADQFKERLEALLLRGGIRQWPRQPLDRHILLKSATFRLQPHRNYSEKEINEQLAPWCRDVGRNMIIDHAVLRRHLVDAGYLTRDLAGRNYRLNEEMAARQFQPGVETINPATVLEDARRRIEEQKRKYLARREQSNEN